MLFFFIVEVNQQIRLSDAGVGPRTWMLNGSNHWMAESSAYAANAIRAPQLVMVAARFQNPRAQIPTVRISWCKASKRG